jgi:hypothetical protein
LSDLGVMNIFWTVWMERQESCQLFKSLFDLWIVDQSFTKWYSVTKKRDYNWCSEELSLAI